MVLSCYLLLCHLRKAPRDPSIRVYKGLGLEPRGTTCVDRSLGSGFSAQSPWVSCVRLLATWAGTASRAPTSAVPAELPSPIWMRNHMEPSSQLSLESENTLWEGRVLGILPQHRAALGTSGPVGTLQFVSPEAMSQQPLIKLSCWDQASGSREESSSLGCCLCCWALDHQLDMATGFAEGASTPGHGLPSCS